MTVQTRDGVTRIRELLDSGPLVRYGAVGNWGVAVRPAAESEGRAVPERFLVLDGEGRRLSADLPGRPWLIRGGLAVLTPSETIDGTWGPGVPGFSVHHVRS